MGFWETLKSLTVKLGLELGEKPKVDVKVGSKDTEGSLQVEQIQGMTRINLSLNTPVKKEADNASKETK
jgi:hypothetical protein